MPFHFSSWPGRLRRKPQARPGHPRDFGDVRGSPGLAARKAARRPGDDENGEGRGTSLMATLTIRLPDDKHARLRELARQRRISMNKLIEEMSTVALTAFDAETRFRLRASRGSAKRGLKLLDKLDRADNDA
jgi:hypothetical protein